MKRASLILLAVLAFASLIFLRTTLAQQSLVGGSGGSTTSTSVSNAVGIGGVSGNPTTSQSNWFVGSGSILNGLPSSRGMTLFYSKPARFYNTFWDMINSSTNQNEAYIQAVIQRWKTNGMLAAGYDLIWLDVGGAATNRLASGQITYAADLYPAGWSNLCHYAHTNGFRMGAYEAVWPLYGDVYNRASNNIVWQSYLLDAQFFATCGFDAVKLDNTQGWQINAPTQMRNSGYVQELRDWVDAIMQTGKPMYVLATDLPYSSGWTGYDPDGNNAPPAFPNASLMVNSLQNSQGGISPLNQIYGTTRTFTNAFPYTFVTRPGTSVQLTDIPASHMSTNDLKAQLTLTYMLHSDSQISEGFPTNGSLLYLTNKDAMAIGDDPGWFPGTNYVGNFSFPMYAFLKPLGQIQPMPSIGWSNGPAKNPYGLYQQGFANSNAIALVNLSSSNFTYTVADTNMGWPAGTIFVVHDCWLNGGSGSDTGTWTNFFTYTLSTSNSALLRVTRWGYQQGYSLARGSTPWDVLTNASYSAGAFPTLRVTNDFVTYGGNSGLQWGARDNDGVLATLYTSGNKWHLLDEFTGTDIMNGATTFAPLNVTNVNALTVQGSLYYKMAPLVKTANYTIVAGESGTWFNNNGAGGTQTNTLPAAATGLTYFFTEVTAQNITVRAAGSDTIRNVGQVSSAGGGVFVNTLGAHIQVFCPVAGQWLITHTNTPWTSF